MEKYTGNSGINSGWPRPLDVRSPKFGQHIRETYKPLRTIVLQVSTQSSRFRYSGWIGEHGGHRQGPYVCEYSEVLLSHEFGTRSFFIIEFSATLRSATYVFIDNACVGAYFPFSVDKGMFPITSPLPHY